MVSHIRDNTHCLQIPNPRTGQQVDVTVSADRFYTWEHNSEEYESSAEVIIIIHELS